MKAKKKPKPNCWKVVTRSGHESSSARGDLRVRYEENVAVSAPVGGLFAFRSKRHAEEFFEGKRLIVVKALGKGRLKLPSASALYPNTLAVARLIWDEIPINREKAVHSWPPGTVAYKEITVLE